MKRISRAFALLAAALLLFANPVVAASYSTDQSDLWWASPPGSENGWGIQFVQRNSTIFATMFVYGPSGNPIWYVATMTPTSSGGFVWTGPLYATTGPWFGAVPYNSNLFTIGAVGTMTWAPSLTNIGTLTYSVNGISVVKTLFRQTLVNENYAGHFAGGIHATASNCANPAFDGTVEQFGILNISQSGTSLVMQSIPSGAPSCTYSGTLVQAGQMGDVQGTYACADGTAGTFHIYEMQVTEMSVTGHFTASISVPAGCQQLGWFGGIVATTF